jgi:hypothetical protein
VAWRTGPWAGLLGEVTIVIEGAKRVSSLLTPEEAAELTRAVH